MNEIPEPWAQALIEAGYTDSRFKASPRPSVRSLAREVGVHATTLTRMFSGDTDTDHSTVESVADALGRSRVEVSSWAQQARSETRSWEPPASVQRLTRREQDALTELINAIVAAQEGGGDHESAPIDEHVSDEVGLSGLDEQAGVSDEPSKGRK